MPRPTYNRRKFRRRQSNDERDWTWLIDELRRTYRPQTRPRR